MARRVLNGTSLSDRIIATSLVAGDFAWSRLGEGNDVFDGSAGGDQAWGEAGNDALFGRAGHDSLVGGDGNDTLDGGADNDTLDGGAGNDILEGGEGDDSLRGGEGNNRINAGAGNDRVTAGDDGDMIWGGTGNDRIDAGGGNNWVYAGEGDDRVTAGDAGDMIWGDAGRDTISAGGGNNWVYGGEGDDRITAGDGGDMLYGDAGNDSILAGNGNNWAYGGEGRDTILGGADNDMLFGEGGDDVLTDLGGNNRVEGGDGHDRVTLGDGDDQVLGGLGDDTVDAGGGRNNLSGGVGADSLRSGAGQDQLDGGEGNDTLRAGAGQDFVQGGMGDDLILQGRGDGAPGQDMLRGGAGFDTLRVEFTRAEWFNGANQLELARLVAANATPAAQSGGVVASSLFGLNFAEIEALSVAVDGTILTAADDAVTVRNDTFTLLEGASLSRSVVSNDIVPDLIASVVLVGAAPSPGTFSLGAEGLMSFDTGTSFEHLTAGQVATLRFNYRVTDADGDTGEARVTLRITGTNDAASISGNSTGAVAEDGTLTTGGTLSVSDVDTGEARFATPGSLTGTYGSFTFDAATGEWGYTLNNSAANVQALNRGQTVQDFLTVTSLDGTASRQIEVSISGQNDAWNVTRVGYYDMDAGQGVTRQTLPIAANLLTPINMFNLTSAELAGVDMLFVWNPSNSSYGSEYLSALLDVSAWVEAGGVLVIHDRFVDSAETILPGGDAFIINRDFSAGTEITFADPNGLLALGRPGTADDLNNASLDNGTWSNHGFAIASSLAARDAEILLTTNTPDQVVTFAYGWGQGAVVYSTIPLDAYVGGSSALGINMTSYATNVIGAFTGQNDIFG
jgi:VCBS repeat-containing protein